MVTLLPSIHSPLLPQLLASPPPHCLFLAASNPHTSFHHHPPSFHRTSIPPFKRKAHHRIASIHCSRICINWNSATRIARTSNVGKQKQTNASLCMRCCSSSSTATTVPEAFGVTESGRFSISDDDLLSRGFELHRSTENIDLDQLNSLFVKVGFPRRQKNKLQRALKHTSSLLWIQHMKSEKLVAFARATGDDIFNAIIWDVVVDPSFQGLGLGKVAMERLMVDLVRKGISNICLYAEPNVVGFYRPLGFVADPDNIRAMAYSKKRR